MRRRALQRERVHHVVDRVAGARAVDGEGQRVGSDADLADVGDVLLVVDGQEGEVEVLDGVELAARRRVGADVDGVGRARGFGVAGIMKSTLS